MDYNNKPHNITSGGGFGPVAKDGYGVSYIIPGDYVLYFHVSSFKSSPDTVSGGGGGGALQWSSSSHMYVSHTQRYIIRKCISSYSSISYTRYITCIHMHKYA